jgi:hypothetical protein
MPDDRVRENAPGIEQSGKAYLEHEYGRLGHFGFIDSGRRLFGINLLDHRPPGVAAKQLVALLYLCAEYGLLFHQLPSHPHALRALT